jgi:hypothetical protein
MCRPAAEGGVHQSMARLRLKRFFAAVAQDPDRRMIFDHYRAGEAEIKLHQTSSIRTTILAKGRFRSPFGILFVCFFGKMKRP